MHTHTSERKALRNAMRTKRRSLNPQQQRHAAQQLKYQFNRRHAWQRSQHIGIYLANDGEINPDSLIRFLWRTKKQCYLPVLHPISKNSLWFYQYTQNTPLKNNRFGIPEPSKKNQRRIPPWALNLVLMPLVAFDNKGGRLGMGGGFYDRTFAFVKKRSGPRLIGLAHAFQQTPTLPVEPWDVPLSAIITDENIWQSGK